MNYPIWDLPAPGLLIAAVAILHVFVSHFAVGGGLFLVWTEAKARREGDVALLDYVKRHSRFFILLTLVFGAITGVGIWFTIGLVHPAATSSLINIFVWGWAIEWVFFFTEIAAAMVYYYGWEKLTPNQHLTVGWIYFGAAWASLVVINGILTFMLAPGAWITTRTFLDAFVNPTYWPALVIRTLGAIGLAGVYALFTSSWISDGELGRRIARYATLGWVVPMAIGLPFALFWFFAVAAAAGVPTAEVLGATGPGMAEIARSLGRGAPTGYPVAQIALRVAVVGSAATILLALASMMLARSGVRRAVSAVLMLAALASVGGAEWVREDLRKPWVIGQYMFVNAVRVPDTSGKGDAFAIERMRETGVLATSKWARPPAGVGLASPKSIDEESAIGREVFRLTCAACHTVDGYLAIRPLVAGWNTGAIEGVIDMMAVPSDLEHGWNAVPVKFASWRGRRMPPFPGNEAEEHALAVYLARLGGGAILPRPAAGVVDGAAIFEDNCSACHGDGADFPIAPVIAGKNRDELHESIGRLPELNEMMPPFEGSDAERDALAEYLAGIAASGKR